MSRSLRFGAVALALTVAAVPAVPTAVAKKKVKIIRLANGSMVFSQGPALVGAMSTAAITPSVVAPGTLDPQGFAFPISSGRVVKGNLTRGFVRSHGGLRLDRGSTSLTFQDFRYHSTSKTTRLTAVTGGKRTVFARSTLTGVKTARHAASVVIDGVRLDLTAGAAHAINAAFQTSLFSAGMRVGQIEIVGGIKP